MTKGETDLLVAALTADGYEAQAAKGGTGDHMWVAEVSGRTTVPADYTNRPWPERLMTLGEWNRRATRQPLFRRLLAAVKETK